MNEFNKYYNYLDRVLVKSKFKIDIFKKGADILLRKFPEIVFRRDASKILINWIVDTDPYNRLQETQLQLNLEFF
jgi:hypothetical protein